MYRCMTKLFLIIALLFCGKCYSGVFHCEDKVYIDADSFKADAKGNEFYVHTGNNIWLVTHTIHRDATGLFAYESNLIRTNMEYEKKWRCPYCYMYWPIGKQCGNKDCPSKYKGPK